MTQIINDPQDRVSFAEALKRETVELKPKFHYDPQFTPLKYLKPNTILNLVDPTAILLREITDFPSKDNRPSKKVVLYRCSSCNSLQSGSNLFCSQCGSRFSKRETSHGVEEVEYDVQR